MSREFPQMRLRMPPELRESIEKASKENGRSLNAEIVHRLEESFKIHEQRAHIDSEVNFLKSKFEEDNQRIDELENMLKALADNFDVDISNKD